MSAAAGSGPVKLEVVTERDAVRSGSQLSVQVRLLDTANQPAAANKAFHVVLQARMPSRQMANLGAVDFAVGESLKRFTATPPGSGLIYLWAKNPELLPGGAFIRIKANAAGTAQGSLQASGPPPSPSPAQPKPGELSVPARAGGRAIVGLSAEGSAAGAREIPAPVHAAAPPAPSIQIALRTSPDRDFLADGNDAVTVQAFLVGDADSAPGDIRLNVFDSSGTLHPSPLVIPQGESSGRAVLTSAQPGVVTVEYLGSTPPAQLQGDQKLQIQFHPAITRLALNASPPGISLLDTSDIVLTLEGNDGRPLATDTARTISLTIASGHGTLDQDQLQIPAGGFEARTRFLPGISGAVSISASTPNLLTVSAPLQVTLPVALLLLAALGGAAGGYLSYVKNKRAGIRQVWIGSVTGFVLYWAAIFLGVASVSRGVALNPLSSLVIAVAGGWLQTSVLGMLTSRLKLRAAKAKA